MSSAYGLTLATSNMDSMSEGNMAQNQEIAGIQQASVIDLVLIDHRYLKECIKILGDKDEDKTKKFRMAKGFLETLEKHSYAEKKAVYILAEKNEDLHFNILEAEIEHGIIDQKVKLLKQRLLRARSLKEDVEVELKVLADLVRRHLLEEESEILPKMQQVFTDDALDEMGAEFMKIRKFSPKSLHDFPVLQDELIHWKDSVQQLSSQFLSKMDQYVENLKH